MSFKEKFESLVSLVESKWLDAKDKDTERVFGKALILGKLIAEDRVSRKDGKILSREETDKLEYEEIMTWGDKFDIYVQDTIQSTLDCIYEISDEAGEAFEKELENLNIYF